MSSIEAIADGLGFTEGPVMLADGRVAVVSISHGCIYVMDPTGTAGDRDIKRIDVRWARCRCLRGSMPTNVCVDPATTALVATAAGHQSLVTVRPF